MKILITGGNGYIGKSLYGFLSQKDNVNVSIHVRDMFDLTNSREVSTFLKDKQYDIIIHTAAVGGSRLKPDTADVLYQNTLSFYNLYENRNYFKNLITFGSGAELSAPEAPYGLSKRIISNIIRSTPGFYNLRIFAVFDKNELPTRFIKSCIINYISKKDLFIHQDKLMDFFSMHDLQELVWYYITQPWQKLPFNINCVYERKAKLTDIANFINTLDTHKCEINIQEKGTGSSYIGNANSTLELEYKGLYPSIVEMYDFLKKEIYA